MRILHTSDWHLGRTLEGISRINEQAEFIDFLCKKADDEKVDLVIIAGDVYDTYNPPALAEKLFYEALSMLNSNGTRAVLVIAGNHDNPERLCAAGPLVGKDGIILLGYPSSKADITEISDDTYIDKNVVIKNFDYGMVELYLKSCGQSAVILTLPYPSESRLMELLSKESDEQELQSAFSQKIGYILNSQSRYYRKDTVNLVTGHFFVLWGYESDSERTIQVGGSLSVNASDLPETAQYIALGHLHRPQSIKSTKCPAYYSGSPLAYSFSEAEHAKAVYIVDIDPGSEPVVNEVLLNCGKPLRRWIAEKGVEQVLEWCNMGRDKNCWVDVEIHSDRLLTNEEYRYIREQHSGIINIRLKTGGETTETGDYERREDRKIDELFSEYFRFRTGLDIDEQMLLAFLEVVNTEPTGDEGN